MVREGTAERGWRSVEEAVVSRWRVGGESVAKSTVSVTSRFCKFEITGWTAPEAWRPIALLGYGITKGICEV